MQKLAELQDRLVDQVRQLRAIAAHLEGAQREQKRLELTQQHMDALPRDTPLYASVGRMYVVGEGCFLFWTRFGMKKVLLGESRDYGGDCSRRAAA